MDSFGSSISSLNTSEASNLLREILQVGAPRNSSESKSMSINSNGHMESDIGHSGDGAKSASLADLINNMSGGVTGQQIMLHGNDNANSFSVYGQDVNIFTSKVSSEQTMGSNKVQIQPVANYDWESKYYIGNVVDAHRNGIHIAYVLKGKSGGLIRVVNKKTAKRGLIKGFTGRVLDVAFSHHPDEIILAAIDEVGDFQVHEIVQRVEPSEDTKIDTVCILSIVRPAGVPPSDYHRVIWCPYIPEAEEEPNDYASKLLVVTHNEKAEVWHTDMVTAEYGEGPLDPSEVEVGFIEIHAHKQAIVDASFAPDGTALATASLDGTVKFFQVYIVQEKTEPRCLHLWQPHNGQPVSSIFFLDDHKKKDPENQFWKYCITGGNNNREIKVWNCQSWRCLQTLRFEVPEDLPSNFYVEPVIKASMDLSGQYLILSDIKRKVLYILQVYQDSETVLAHVSSVSEFLLAQPILSFTVLDVSCKKFRRPEDDQDDDDQGSDDDEGGRVEVGVSVKLYSVTSRALQELTVRFHPHSSIPQPIPASISSLSQDDMGLRDGLTDISMDTMTSEDVEASFHSDSSKARENKPVLMTPAAFTSTSSPKTKHPESPGQDTHRSTVSSSSFTQVSALEDVVTPHSSVEQSILSPNLSFKTSNSVSSSSRTLSPESSRTLTPSAVPLPHVAPTEERLGVSPRSPLTKSDNFNTSDSLSNDTFMKTDELVQRNAPYAATGSPFSPTGSVNNKTGKASAIEETVDAIFDAEGSHRAVTSTSSSSSTSLEVSEILAGEIKHSDLHKVVDEEDEDEADDDEQNEDEDDVPTSRTDLPPGADATIWPKAPHVPLAQGTDQNYSGNTQEDEDVKIEGYGEGEEVDEENEANKDEVIVERLPTNNGVPIQQIQNTMEDILAVLQVQQQEIYHLKQQQTVAIETQQSMSQSADRQASDVALFNRIESLLNKHSEAEDRRLQKVMKGQESQEKAREERITQSLCSTLSQKVDKTIRAEVKHILVPSITKTLDPLKEQLHTEMANKLTATDALMKENIGKLVRSKQTIECIGQAAGQAVLGVVQSTYRESFHNLVIPTFDRACQNMMKQVNDTFHSGTKDYMKQLETQLDRIIRKHQEQRDPAVGKLQSTADTFNSQLDHLQSSITKTVQEQLTSQLEHTMHRLQEAISSNVKHLIQEEISSALRDQNTAVTENLIAAMRANASTPVPLPPDPQQQKTQIMQLLRNGQLNSAFQQALSAADLDLVMFVCETVDPSQVFEQTPCPLQQPVILSLIQQLSADLESSTELKHRYLQDALMNLDTHNPVTNEHMFRVLNGLVQSLTAFIQSNPADKMNRHMRMLLMATQSLLK